MKYVLCSIEGETAYIRLNRTAAMNALSTDMMKELCCCLKEVSRNDDVDIVVLSGEGAVFSAGGDIKEMLSAMDEEQFPSVMDTIADIALCFYSMPKLTIAAIHGAAAGLGLSIALGADFVLCETDSKLAMNFIGIGLIPDGGGHFMLERRLGAVKAKKVIWDGKIMSGAEAAEMGLVDRSVASGTVQQEVAYLMKELHQKPIQAMIKTKKIMADMNRPQLLKTLELEKQGQLKMRETKDHQEGIRAFLEKRKPVFNQ
ncbi:enoyl-CoA hydratase [Domibacillus iocasae]|uniref:Enoyl-CoA hydratase n=1 Tax=Domibacillus iocasae TaxID=1714016 RepID=A0A1E7DLL8_9BACI|nr:enoyl-CoA hydratase [Domibacillus iocasae]OES43972.1 enoyl-CoA hydratase [Domibacillus iocasae]